MNVVKTEPSTSWLDLDPNSGSHQFAQTTQKDSIILFQLRYFQEISETRLLFEMFPEITQSVVLLYRYICKSEKLEEDTLILGG